MLKAELHLAFFWICEECGRDNFCRSINTSPADMPEDMVQDLRERGMYDPDAGVGGQFSTRPDTVTCCHCESVFEAQDAGSEESD